MNKTEWFWKSLKIQIVGFWESFQISIERNSKNIMSKINSNLFVNNQPRRHCKTLIILFPKRNKKIKLIKTIFLKI